MKLIQFHFCKISGQKKSVYFPSEIKRMKKKARVSISSPPPIKFRFAEIIDA